MCILSSNSRAKDVHGLLSQGKKKIKKSSKTFLLLPCKEVKTGKRALLSSSTSLFHRPRNWVQKSEVTYLRLWNTLIAEESDSGSSLPWNLLYSLHLSRAQIIVPSLWQVSRCGSRECGLRSAGLTPLHFLCLAETSYISPKRLGLALPSSSHAISGLGITAVHS